MVIHDWLARLRQARARGVSPHIGGDVLQRLAKGRVVDDPAKELTVRFKPAIDEMPAHSQANGNSVAIKCGFFLSYRSEIHAVEFAAVGVAPP